MPWVGWSEDKDALVWIWCSLLIAPFVAGVYRFQAMDSLPRRIPSPFGMHVHPLAVFRRCLARVVVYLACIWDVSSRVWRRLPSLPPPFRWWVPVSLASLVGLGLGFGFGNDPKRKVKGGFPWNDEGEGNLD